MKLSLQRRIQLSFLLSITLVAAIGAISFYYIHQLNEQLQQIVDEDIALSHSGEKIKTMLFSLRRVERVYLLDPDKPGFHENMQEAINELRDAVEEGYKLTSHPPTKELHKEVLESLKDYELVINGTTLPFSPRQLAQLLDEKTRRIRAAVSEIAQNHYENLEAHRKKEQQLSDRSSRNLILMIATTILAGLAVGFFAPSKVVIPFKKLQAAIQEVQQANFNVSVHIGGNDEISELADEFNKMVEEIRVFDDMKIKKIAFEKRKLDTLANMIPAGVIVLSVEGNVIYMNRSLYEMLGLTSERVLHASVDESPLPEELKTLFRESIERKDRFEDRKWEFTFKRDDGAVVKQAVRINLSPVRNHIGDIVNFVVVMNKTGQDLVSAATEVGETA